MLVCILAFSHPHILRFLCIWLYPHVLTSLCHIPRFVCICLYPRILTSSYPQVHIYLLVSLHLHIVRFMCTSFYPCILSSSYIHNTDLHFANKYLHKYALKNSCNLQYNKRIKPIRYWTQH